MLPGWFFPLTRAVLEGAREWQAPNLVLVGLGVIAAPFIDLFIMPFVVAIQAAVLTLRGLGWLAVRVVRIGI